MPRAEAVSFIKLLIMFVFNLKFGYFLAMKFWTLMFGNFFTLITIIITNITLITNICYHILHQIVTQTIKL